MLKYTIRSAEVSTPSAKPWSPHDYQVRGMEFLLMNAGAGLFLDPGLGKTSITLGAIAYLKKAKTVGKVLVIAPLRVCQLVWPAEIEKWADFGHLKVVVLHGKDKDKLLKEDADIYVINPAGLQWFFQKKGMQVIKPDLLVVDESSQFKHSNTKRYKLLKPALAKFRRRWILTGTPASNGLLDLFGQVYLMDLGRALSPYISHYRNNYFTSGAKINRTFVDRVTGLEKSVKVAVDWTPQPGAEELIYEKLRPYVLRLEAKDHLKLPEMIESEIYVDLPPDAKKIYREIEDSMVAEINGNLLTAVSAASVSIKCRQICSGGVYRQFEIDDMDAKGREREVIHIHDEKTDALEELVGELQGAPLLVAYEFQHSLARMQARFGKDLPYIGGGSDDRRTKMLVDAWNRGEIPILAGHPRSMGHGLNMQAAGHHVAWYDPTYDAELYEQFNKRVLRQGNTHAHVFVYRFAARSSVDLAVLASLRLKVRNQNALLTALKDYAVYRPTILQS